MQAKSKKVIIWSVVAVFVIIAAAFFLIPRKSQAPAATGNLDALAQCLKDKGAIFYGASWCPHCQAQKALFGNSEKLLPYVECATPDGQGQTQVCADAKIDGYPTWVFADGTRQSGEQTLEALSQKTGCPLPQ